MIEIEYISEFESPKDTLYRALTDEQQGVFSVDLGEYLPRYNDTTLYLLFIKG